MLNQEFMNDLCCPQALVQGQIINLNETEASLQSDFDTYPIIDGVPDLRLASDREGTSYDNILTEWMPLGLEGAAMARYAEMMEIQQSDIENKKVLIAGVGIGTEIDMILTFKPRIVYALDFSSYILLLAKSEKYADAPVRFLMGDICNLPFKSEIFDYVVSGGIIHHTRSPELAHRSIWKTVKKGGHLNYGHIYLEGLHNRRVSIDRLRKQYHKMAPEVARRKLYTYTKFYTFLVKTGLLRLFNRNRFRAPFLLELSGARNKGFKYHYTSATDYYMCRYRHMIPEEDVLDWFRKVGGQVKRVPKGFLGTKI